ncbi:hypothetical protein M9H77_00818 [Catharanthus roseus]|uniref:Uncharacterized protein n=1 Tax=Catharanthus roseus TaxID=4058 RepID=A0ACC0C3T1_CATRO|nr:hypothetical protein M9H77_00818 [Catharanthus roseus]
MSLINPDVVMLLLMLLIASALFRSSNASSSSSAAPALQTLQLQPQSFNPKLPPRTLSSSKKFEGSSDLVNLRYHMGPVLSSPINIYLIWYGKWAPSQQLLIKDFLLSISTTNHRAAPSPSVAEWWRTVSLYTDQTGANISRSVLIAGEYTDRRYSLGKQLTRLSMQQVIDAAVRTKPFTVDLQYEREEEQEVYGSVGLESGDQGLCGSQRFGLIILLPLLL